jgi:3-methylcrotonyl-CoA carboxylase beta subunit
MESLDSRISTKDERFHTNTAHNRALADQLHQRLAEVYEGGGEKYQQRQREQGKLFVRERIDKLLDRCWHRHRYWPSQWDRMPGRRE